MVDCCFINLPGIVRLNGIQSCSDISSQTSILGILRPMSGPCVCIKTLFVLESFSRTQKTWPIFNCSMNHSYMPIYVASMFALIVALVTPI